MKDLFKAIETAQAALEAAGDVRSQAVKQFVAGLPFKIGDTVRPRAQPFQLEKVMYTAAVLDIGCLMLSGRKLKKDGTVGLIKAYDSIRFESLERVEADIARLGPRDEE